MRIGLDVSGAVGRPSGLRRYVESLLRGFAEAGGDDEFFVYAAFWGDFPARGLSSTDAYPRLLSHPFAQGRP